MIIIINSNSNISNQTKSWIKITNCKIVDGLVYHKITIPYTVSNDSIEIDYPYITHHYCRSTDTMPATSGNDMYISTTTYNTDSNATKINDNKCKVEVTINQDIDNGTHNTSAQGNGLRITNNTGSRIRTNGFKLNYVGVKTNAQIP